MVLALAEAAEATRTAANSAEIAFMKAFLKESIVSFLQQKICHVHNVVIFQIVNFFEINIIFLL
jgi:hypothetical protein